LVARMRGRKDDCGGVKLDLVLDWFCLCVHARAQKQDGEALRLRGGSDGNVWAEQLDPGSGKTYYYNVQTMATAWTLPEGATLQGPPKPVTIPSPTSLSLSPRKIPEALILMLSWVSWPVGGIVLTATSSP
jgi:hypothetical protein